MDYVYICKHGDNEELKYSIRSVVKNLPTGKIWVVGGKPEWYSGNYILVPDFSGKFANIKTCLETIINTAEISEDFILMNDDFFITKKQDSLPIFHGGPLSDKINRYKELRPGSRYAALLSKTYAELERMGYKEPLDYDIHVPMPMNKTVLRNIFRRITFLRSGYGNVASIGGRQIVDVKVYQNKPDAMPSYDYLNDQLGFLSSEDSSFSEMISFLSSEFPDKSKYES
jgi:hypothetical protein